MSEFYYEETPEIRKSLKSFCDKTNKYALRQLKIGKDPILKIPTYRRGEDQEIIMIERCFVTPSEYDIRVKEKTVLKRPNKDGQKELGGGELWIQSTNKMKKDKMPLMYVFSDSIDHWNDIMDKIGIKDKLKFVNESERDQLIQILGRAGRGKDIKK